MPAEVIEGVIKTVHANADASLVRIADAYGIQLLETNAQLVRASQFKSEFLAKMSHQLRTPLTAIIGFCEVLAQGMDGELSRDQAQDVADIHKSGIVLLELVNDILDLPTVVDQVISSMHQIAETKALRLTSELSTGARRVMGDPVRVREILTNLVLISGSSRSSGRPTTPSLGRTAALGSVYRLRASWSSSKAGRWAWTLSRAKDPVFGLRCRSTSILHRWPRHDPHSG